jgi:hypothetical protein
MTSLQPECVLAPESSGYASKSIRSIRFANGDLVIDIEGEPFGRSQVTFRGALGFRVLDERELTEFWNTYSQPQGWLWEVKRGGWLDLETMRPNLNLLQFPAREFFVVDEFCVSVWSPEPPEFSELGSDSPAA